MAEKKTTPKKGMTIYRASDSQELMESGYMTWPTMSDDARESLTETLAAGSQAGQHVRLVGHDPDRAAGDPGEADDDVGGVAGLHLQEVRPVDDAQDDLAHVVALLVRRRQDVPQLGVGLDGVEDFDHRGADLGADRVAGVGSVEGDEGDGAPPFEFYESHGGGPYSDWSWQVPVPRP